MPSIGHGVGFRFYGRRDFRADRSYLTTKFFCIFYFPIVPISTLRVIPSPKNSRLPLGRERYTLVAKGSPHIGQVASVYATAALIVAYGVGFFNITFPWMRRRYGNGIGDFTEFALFVIWMAVPWLLIQWVRNKELERVMEDHRDLNSPTPIC